MNRANRTSPLLAYMQLLRLPNVFTAIADVWMGHLIVHGAFGERPVALAALTSVSVLIYLAGMVLNDVFDHEVDARERPHRPIPSGRIHSGFARTLGFCMLALGVGLALSASLAMREWRPAATAGALAVMVYLYDAKLKQTLAGPFAMGACRMLNVLLGMSIASDRAPDWEAVHWVIAGGVGLYIVGVTWYARTEAAPKGRAMLVVGLIGMLAGLGLLFAAPEYYNLTMKFENRVTADNWRFCWMILAAAVVWRSARGIAAPSPASVQGAVKQAILSLIVIDAVTAIPIAGWNALLIVALLIPAMSLGRWVYST